MALTGTFSSFEGSFLLLFALPFTACIKMDILEQYKPQTNMQRGLAVAGFGILAYYIYNTFLRKTQKLSGKVCLITGASSGIGEALAHEFVKAGCKVLLAARSVEKLEELKRELIEQYRIPESHVRCFFLDLADHESIPATTRNILEAYGRVDILINNAGVVATDKVVRMDMSVYKKVLDVNFFGQVALTKEILPSMIDNGGGTIAAVSSLQGRFSIPGSSAYAASKHALQAFCDSLRAEYTKKKIQVLVVSPSFVKTNISRSGLRGDGSQPGVSQKAIEQGMSAVYCAQSIVASVRQMDPELLLGPFHHIMVVYIRVLFPKLYMYVVAKLF